jgi:hypothetical protein
MYQIQFMVFCGTKWIRYGEYRDQKTAERIAQTKRNDWPLHTWRVIHV